MNKRLRLLCSAALLGLLAWRTNWHQVADAFAHLRWGLWLLAALLYASTQVVSSLRWQWLARPLGFALPLRRYLAFYYVGMFFNLVLPTSVGGDVVRAWYLAGHPDANQVVMAASGQPRAQAASNLRSYFTAHPQEYYDLRGILAPIGDTQRQCNVTVLPPDLASAYDQFMTG